MVEMSSDETTTDETTAYATASLPEWQKQQWEQEAETMNMTLSCYTRTMVEAGRSKIGVTDTQTPNEFTTGNIEDQIRETLAEQGPLSWDALLDAVLQNMENRIDQTVSEMADVSVKKGKYTLTKDQ